MAKNYSPGDEPVPGSGYRLSEFLGRGGFGEVWKANGPGGVEVALKIIHLGGVAGRKEFRALQLVKRIHHPNAVPIVAYWLKAADGSVLDDDCEDWDDISGQTGSADAIKATAIAPPDLGKPQATELVIVMGLGDISLFDRLGQCREQGLPGIAEDELLGYLESAAKAIDYLNSPIHKLGQGPSATRPVAIQHCDIKPQNILIVGNATQVCDFGLARMMGTERATTTAATIAYAAPECLVEGNPSDTTDQYSLAVSYYELRTGRLPYDNEAPAAVMDAKIKETLNFDEVSPAQQAVLHRATSRDPAARFATSADMISALRDTAGGGLDRTAVYQDRLPRPRTGRPASKLLAGVALLSIAVAAGWFIINRERPHTASTASNTTDTKKPGEPETGDTPANPATTTTQPQRPSPEELHAQARRSLADKDYPNAIVQIEKAVLSSNDPQLLKALRATAAEAYLARGLQTLDRWKSDYINAEGAADTGPSSIKQWQAAVDDFSMAARHDPQNPLAYSRRGLAHYLIENWKQAAQDIIKAVELKPYAGDYIRLGQICEQLNDAQGASKAYQAAVAADPQDADAHYLLGIFQGDQELYHKAIQSLTKAIDLYDKSGAKDNLLAALQLRTGYLQQEARDQESINDITRIVELDPAQKTLWAETCHESAVGAAQQNETQRAVLWAEKAVQLAIDNNTKAAYQKSLDEYRKKLADKP